MIPIGGREPSRRALLALVVAFAALAAPVASAQGRIEADPDRAVAGFEPHELPFELPADAIARAEFRSEPFYAVLLRTLPRCAVTEEERLAVQALFPERKVFADRFDCGGDLLEDVAYTNVDDRFGFIAVYAGTDRDAAMRLLREIEASGRFPGANVRPMQAVLVYP